MTSKSTLPPQKMNIDLASIGRELKTSVSNIEAAVKLLDDGNTIPFITRFRKDQTGGLTEDQLLTIKTSVTKLRALSERKAFIVKSIDSQGKLTDELSKQIEAANSSRELEDLYHPFKARKQTLATVARQNGLEPLALDIFEGREPEKDLASRATDFVRVDKNLNSVDEVIAGVGHILAEKFSDNSTLRKELRGIISDGKLSTKLIEIEEEPESDDDSEDSSEVSATTTPKEPAKVSENPETVEVAANAGEVAKPPVADIDPETNPNEPETTAQAEGGSSEPTAEPTAESTDESTAAAAAESTPMDGDVTAAADGTPENSDAAPQEAIPDSPPAQVTTASLPAAPKKKKKRKKKKKKAEDPYREYHDFAHPISKMPYHKTLAINRGEKNGRLKVKIQFNDEQFLAKANSSLVPQDHPFCEFLQSCVKDAMNRLVAPSLEREMRREITEAAEKHAVSVFARNLKNLLLQSPVRDQRVVAIDPGYKRGCSVAVLDTNGELLENAHIFVVGNEKRIEESKQNLFELIDKYSVTLIAIGNGAACREAEQVVSDMIKESSTEKELKYAMVNEAGASFYSTSEVGREEFPDLSPAVRSAVSIGRRLMDPLSELVKISPANIGVGLYQHDVRAKHLADSLDDVVQFCVNRVGVDVNTASTSLMKYVSGMNQLTARRVLEFRQANGPFKNREELKKVTGFGDATFVQSAGFLRVHSGDQPLDTTGIHPEFYETAAKIIERIGGSNEELFPIATAANSTAESPKPLETTDNSATIVEIKNDKITAQSSPSTDSTEVSTEATTESPTSTTEGSPVVDTTPTDANDSSAAILENSGKTTEPATEPASEVELVSESGDAETPSTAESKPSKTTAAPAAEPTTQPAADTKPIAKPVLRLTAEQSKRRKELIRSIRELDTEQLAKELNVGRLLMKDIMQSLCRPEYDPRNNVNRPVFRSGIIKIDDLKPEMCLDAQVVNVVDFGVFVDIGLGTSCLVHVSQLSNHFIRDPHRFYAVGDSLKVWVTEVETEKRRVKLTAVQPGSANRPKRNTKRPKPEARRPKFQKSGKQPNRSEKKFTKARRKPKPVKPITDDMLKGSEPMRSFSDLAQFFDTKPEDKNKKD